MKHLAYQQYLSSPQYGLFGQSTISRQYIHTYPWNPYQFTLSVYQTGSKSLTCILSSFRQKYETGIALLASSNPKVFPCSKKSSMETDLGVIAKEPEAHAELFNEFYDDVFCTDAGQPIPALPIPSGMMGIPVFTPCLVHIYIQCVC